MEKKTGLILLITSVFFLYFISEACLRCAAVANINPEKVKLDTILNDLPESVRDLVTYRVMYTDLRNNLEKAETEQEKLSALAQLGDYTRDAEEKEQIFSRLREKYPSAPEASFAFVYYFLNENNPKKIGIPEFQRYLNTFPQLERYNVWAMAINKMVQLKLSDRERLDFMMPLLDMRPEYRDYSVFYTEMVRLASKLGLSNTANKADGLIDDSRLCPSITEVVMEREMKAEAEKGKKGK